MFYIFLRIFQNVVGKYSPFIVNFWETEGAEHFLSFSQTVRSPGRWDMKRTRHDYCTGALYAGNNKRRRYNVLFVSSLISTCWACVELLGCRRIRSDSQLGRFHTRPYERWNDVIQRDLCLVTVTTRTKICCISKQTQLLLPCLAQSHVILNLIFICIQTESLSRL